MILDALYLIGVTVLGFFNWVLSFFNLPYVSNMVGAITWAVQMIVTLNDQFPVFSLLQCLVVLLTTWVFRFKIKLVFETIWPMVPFIGRKINLPTIGHRTDMNQPYYQSIRSAEGNENGMGTFYLYKHRGKDRRKDSNW